MRDEHKLGLMMARLADLVQKNPAAVDDHRAALRALTELANKRSWTLTVDGSVLSIEGTTIPSDIPFIRSLTNCFEQHDIAELSIAHRAAALDIIHAIKIIASRSGDASAVMERLHAQGVKTVTVIGVEEEKSTRERRTIRVTDALKASGVIDREADRPAAAGQDSSDPSAVTRDSEAAYGEMVAHQRAAAGSLTQAVAQLKNKNVGPGLSRGLNAVRAGVVEALRDNRIDEAVEAILLVIDQEAAETRSDVRGSYSVTLSRMLAPELLPRLTKLLVDPLYVSDVTRIIRRAGSRGTQVLLEMLVTAATFAERKAYLEVLRRVSDGTELLVRMLNHHEWYVIRNVADVIGELKMIEAVDALGKVAGHRDKRVRKSVGIALAKIGVPKAGPYLRNLLQDEDSDIRLAVTREVNGRGLAALAMPLVKAIARESDESIKQEYYLALGRIGTPDAVQALIKAAKPGGLLKTKRDSARRLAAVQGLSLASPSGAAVTALKSLSRDRNKHVRRAVLEALENHQTTRVD